MILTFLRAEVDSPRFGELVQRCLWMLRCNRTTIDNADLTDIQQNRIRKELLGCFRGYGKDAYLFRGFPQDTKWRRVSLETADLQRLLYAKEPSWIDFSDGTRLVSVGAKNALGRPMGQGAIAVARAVREGARLPPLIAAESECGALIIVEGATRATAYMLAQSSCVEAIVGTSTQMSRWAFY